MSDSNPYVEARREWNDRYLELAHERRLWQMLAGVGLLLSLILAAGFVWLSLQHKTIPYILEVDSLGAAMAIKPADNGGHPADERIVRYQFATFIRGARQVMTDRIAMKRGLEQVYAYVRGAARTYLAEYYRAHNPFEIRLGCSGNRIATHNTRVADSKSHDERLEVFASRVLCDRLSMPQRDPIWRGS